MVFRHGKDTIVLVGPYDLSPWLNEVSASTEVETADTSHFGTQSKTFLTGSDDGSFSFSGLFDGSKTALEDKITAITNATNGMPVTAATDGGAVIGRRVRYGMGRRTNWDISAPFSDVVSVSGGLQADGGIRSGWLLNNLVPFSAAFDGTAVDTIQTTTNGARIGFHATSNTRSAAMSLIVQHNTVGTGGVWVDLATLNVPAGQIASGEVVVNGTVNRYLRLRVTGTGTGAMTATATAARQ